MAPSIGEWIEKQLAHALKDPNRRAYNRTKHLPERKEMVQARAVVSGQSSTHIIGRAE